MRDTLALEYGAAALVLIALLASLGGGFYAGRQVGLTEARNFTAQWYVDHALSDARAADACHAGIAPTNRVFSEKEMEAMCEAFYYNKARPQPKEEPK